MKFRVDIVDLDKKPHNACFVDFARALEDALRTLGHEIMPDGRPILFGANDATSKTPLPKDAILYNAEQLANLYDPERVIGDTAPTRIIWDYAKINVLCLQGLGFGRPVLCPVGYVPSMTTIKPVDEDIDVLFYGWINSRRQVILDALAAAGMRVGRVSGIYGPRRDALIARSKVVLNMHFYENGIFEIFRCSHLLANQKCVVTESGGGDVDLERVASLTCASTPLNSIVETCRAFVDSTFARKAQAEKGFEAFKKFNLIENVRQAIEKSQP